MENLPPEVVLKIMRKAEDKEVYHMCRWNRYYESICDERFWKERTQSRYSPFLHLINKFSSWEDFHFNLSQKSLYMVLIYNKIHLVNDIIIAYELIIGTLRDKLALDPLDAEIDFMNVDQLRYFASKINFPMQIYFILLGEDTDSLLLNIGRYDNEEEDVYIHPFLNYVPKLHNTGNFIVFKYLSDGDFFISIDKPKETVLQKAFELAKHDYLWDLIFSVLSVNDTQTNIDGCEYDPDISAFVNIQSNTLIILCPKGFTLFTVVPGNDIRKILFSDIFENYKDRLSWRKIEEHLLIYSLC